MNLASLQERVRRHVKVDLAPLFDAYKVEKKSDDIDGFVSYLVKSRVFDASLVREIYLDTDVDVGPDESLALAGTLMSRKAGGTMVMGPSGGAATSGATASRTPAELSTMVGGFSEGDAAAGPAAEAQEARFEPIARLAQGAMGAIDVARDVYLRRRVALKTVLPEMAVHKALLARFLAEMQITAQLEHPNIVPVYALEVGADGTLGYVMKLVNGKDLSQLLEEARAHVAAGKPLPANLVLEQRLEVFLKVCDALEYAHAKGILHRDLKPANVMVGKHNEVYLMDWGIARPMGTGGQAIDAGIELIPPDGEVVGLRTRVGSTIGTPTYMSPEQAAGKNHELDGRSDLYTMGLILQECVTLKQAVGGATLEEVLTKAREARRDPIEVGVKPGELPRELEAIVVKATSREVNARYASIKALADDVRHFLRNEPIAALPDNAVRKATRWISRNRTTSLALMMSIALFGSVATIVTQRIGQGKIEALFKSELRQSEFETESAIAAHLLDRKLARYEVALSQLAGAAQAALSKPDTSGIAVFADDFKPGAGPPDLAASKRYGTSISILAPAVALGPGMSKEQAEPVARSLAGVLGPAFREALLDTAGVHSHELSPEGAWAHIAVAGTPAMRAHLVLADGLTIAFPGSASAAAVDVANDPAYQAAAKTTGFHWSKPAVRGATSVLPVSTAIYAGSEFRGVVVLEIAMDRLLEQRGQPELEYVQTRLLLARDGTVKGEESGEGGRAPLAKVVVDAVAQGKSGSVEYDEDGRRWMATYYSLTALDWSFVSIADMGRMMASKKVIVASDARAAVSAAAAPPVVSAAPAPAPTAPPPPTAPTASASAEPEPSAAPSASAPPAPSLGPPWPKTSAAPAAPSVPAAPSAPRNPFDKWEEYKK